MRYLLSWHIREAEIRTRSPAWREEVVAFLAQYEDELFVNSELDWVEVLDQEPSHRGRTWCGGSRWFFLTPVGTFGESLGDPRLRSSTSDRCSVEFAGQLDTWIEVRECLPSAQRP